MATINLIEFDLTLKNVDRAIEQKQLSEPSRQYLGMSVIGDDCWRKLFYMFRNAEKRKLSISSIKAIEDGYAQEKIMADRLRLLPDIELITEENNRQIEFSLLEGHFRGHADGMIRGIFEAQKTWHVWENKAVNDKKFKELIKIRNAKGEKESLMEWDIVYFCQAQIYMHCANVERHYLTVTNPGGRDYISVRTNYNKKIAQALIVKAQSIIFDNDMLPTRQSDKKDFFKCKWCEFQSICHDYEFPAINCKTCRNCQFVSDGKLFCLFNEKEIQNTEEICDNHLYNPALIQTNFIEHQNDCCIYYIKNKKIKFANCTKIGFPKVEGDHLLIYTSQELRNKIKNLNEISI